MAAKSDNKYDIHDWIIKIMESCETFRHYARCIVLKRRFKIMFPNDQELHDILDWKHNAIFYKYNQK